MYTLAQGTQSFGIIFEKIWEQKCEPDSETFDLVGGKNVTHLIRK